MNKWVRQAMEVLFTHEELLEGYVCEESSTSHYKRLDPERIELLKKALFIKYNVNKQDQIKIWKQMKPVACRKCIDTRNIETKKTVACRKCIDTRNIETKKTKANKSNHASKKQKSDKDDNHSDSEDNDEQEQDFDS